MSGRLRDVGDIGLVCLMFSLLIATASFFVAIRSHGIMVDACEKLRIDPSMALYHETYLTVFQFSRVGGLVVVYALDSGTEFVFIHVHPLSFEKNSSWELQK